MGLNRFMGALLPILMIVPLLLFVPPIASSAPVGSRLTWKDNFTLPDGYSYSSCSLIVQDNEQIVVTGGPNCYNTDLARGPPEVWYRPGDLVPWAAAAKVGSGRVVAVGGAGSLAGETLPWDLGADKIFDAIYDWLDPTGTNRLLWYEGRKMYYKTDNCLAWVDHLRKKGYTVDAYSPDTITAVALFGYTILQIGSPIDNTVDNYTAIEENAIRNWVEAGGGLLLCCQAEENGYPEYHNSILKALGVNFRFQDDKLLDNVEYYPGEGTYAIRLYFTDHEITPLGVDATISLKYQETWRGGILTYDVTVQNIGPKPDSYSLSYVHITDWPMDISPYIMSNVQPGEKRLATLRITIPSGAAIGDEDRITITATSQYYAGVSDNDTCIARTAERITIPPFDDAYTHKGRPSTNFGGGDDIFVGWYQHEREGVGGSERTWLKFDLSSLPADATIGRMRLWLYCHRLTGWGSHDTRCYSVENDNWTEKSITWNNQPPTIGELLDNKVVEEENRWYSWEVTSFVQSQRAKDNLVSFCLIDRDENQEENHSPWFYSKEFGTYENAGLWPYLEFPLGRVERSVEISISPSYQSGQPGTTLSYTVTVVNTGNVPDTYMLENFDNAGWALSLDTISLAVPAGESRTATINVIIPENAENCTRDNMIVTAISQENSEVKDNGSCIAHCLVGPPKRGVRVLIDPTSKSGAQGENVTFTVTVTNTGDNVDAFRLKATDTENWGPTLSVSSITLAEGESETVELRITIPDNATKGASTTITVTATGTGYENSATCTVRVAEKPSEIPIPLIAGAAIGVGAVAAIVLLLKRRA